jgi:hypothetical protein
MIKKALAVFAILSTVSAQAQFRICANKTTGNILIRATCFSSENTVTNIASLKGPKGDTGLQGLQGLTGAQGTQGLKGDTGTQGLKGDTGAQGTQGIKGDTGVQGPVADVTQCRKVITPQSTPTENNTYFFWVTAACEQGEFLLNHAARSTARYYDGGSVTIGGMPNKGNQLEYLNSATYPSGVSYQFPGQGLIVDTEIMMTCCPLPQ